MTELPCLILVTGAPASGKSVLAAQLARHLTWPLLSRDRLRELLSDTFSNQLDVADLTSDAAWTMFYSLTTDLLRGGSNVIAESSVHAQRAVSELAPVLAHAVTAHIHLDCARGVRVERYQARARDRHPCFDDLKLADRYRNEPDRWSYFEEPPTLGKPLLRLDTTSGQSSLHIAIKFIDDVRRLKAPSGQPE